MPSGYREDRRIDAIKPLRAVSKNEATEATDLRREKAIELERERIADQLRLDGTPKRNFADLIKQKKP
ncbi:MAG: hypothetical protein QM817_38170 [Archangium sp.]